ncbi:MAG: hypothetical protein ACLRWP_15540 [Bilophila wadsworthia]
MLSCPPIDDGTRLRVAERSRRHLRDDLVYSARAEQTPRSAPVPRDRRGDACGVRSSASSSAHNTLSGCP